MQLDGTSLAIEVSPNSILVLELWLLGLGAVLILAGFAVLFLARVVTRQAASARPVVVRAASLDVASLNCNGPAAEGPQLEFYGTPVRIALVVLAPVGRDSGVPRQDEVPRILEQLVPRLGEIAAAQAPTVHIWPEQLSSQGFTNAFFSNVALPGNRGKATPWCSVAGKFTANARQYLIGLVCCGERANSLTQFVIEHEGRWNDVLRVRV